MRPAWMPVVLAIVALCGGTAMAGKGGGGKPGGGDPPAPPPANPDVVLKVGTSYDSPNEGTLYVMNADGSEKVEIYSGYVNGRPCWSSDGTHILFGGDADGPGIYRIKPDGTELTKVVSTFRAPFKLDVSPVATPDGNIKIVYEVWVDRDGNGISDDIDIYVVNEDGSGAAANLTDTAAVRERHPTWSKDGDMIAFARQVIPYDIYSGQDIILVELTTDTQGKLKVLSETCLTDGVDVAGSPLADEDSVSQPDFARTGDVLAVLGQGSDGAWDSLWLIDLADPANPVDLMAGLSAQNVRQPTWAPDDTSLMYNGSNDQYATGSLWTIDADGTNRVELVRREGSYDRKRKIWPDNNCLPFWKR